MSIEVSNKCKAITWSTTLFGSIGIGVFKDDFGNKVIRICQILGNDIDHDTKTVYTLGATLPESELKRLLSAYKER
jgi:hypothetical protein